ncbi:MAG: hypothetical protein AAFO51_01580 [Pseudomonadota bacterium]
MARRRGRGRRRAQQRRAAYLNIFLVTAAIGIVGFLFWSLQPAPYDERTLCEISDELPPHTAIIIDKTDEYSQIQADLISDVVRRTRDRLEVGERMTLFELDADGRFDPRGQLSLCNPGRGDQVNPLFSNPKLIEERYAALFEGPMETILSDLVEPKEAPASPILEALARLGQTEAFSSDVDGRTVVLVSDMLQNSTVFTAYGGAGALPETILPAFDTADVIDERFGDGLRGVYLEIRLIPRERHLDLQRGPLKAYWDDVFRELGVETRWRDL